MRDSGTFGSVEGVMLGERSCGNGEECENGKVHCGVAVGLRAVRVGGINR